MLRCIKSVGDCSLVLGEVTYRGELNTPACWWLHSLRTRPGIQSGLGDFTPLYNLHTSAIFTDTVQSSWSSASSGNGVAYLKAFAEGVELLGSQWAWRHYCSSLWGIERDPTCIWAWGQGCGSCCLFWCVLWFS